MKTLLKISLVLGLLLSAGFLFAADTVYLDTVGIGTPLIQPQVVAAAPAQPYACAAAQRGRMLYVDDTNDTDEAFLCFCGVDADDSTHIWLKVEDPDTNCF